MTTMRPLLLVCLCTFGVTLGVLIAMGPGASAPEDRRSAQTTARRGSIDARVTRLQAKLRAQPTDVDSLVQLGTAYLKKVRESGDISYYERAERALTAALERDPKNAAAYTERGLLRLARHDFRRALSDGRRARALAPGVVKPLGVLVDANVETGRYDDAAEVLQQMIDLKPNLDSYARVSYFRELHGDLDGAAEALELAESAGGDGPENVAYIQSLQGTLEFNRARPGRARRAFELALRRVPGYGPAEYGLARLDAGAGRLDVARRRLQALAENRPELYYLSLLGETELAAGKPDAARRAFEMVRVRRQQFTRASANTDVESAVFEADHGDRGAAVAFARKAWRSAPSVTAADALGWALTRNAQPREGLAWARRSLRLGSRDPMFIYHAGMAARAAGRPAEAIRLLRSALKTNPGFSPLYAPRARRALTTLERETA